MNNQSQVGIALASSCTVLTEITVLGIMKRIMALGALVATMVLAACGQSGYRVANQVLQQAVTGFAMADIPYHQKPHYISPPVDARMGDVDINLLLRGKTVVSRSIEETSAVQYSYFAPDGLLAINPRPGRLVLGRWRVDNRRLCYDISNEVICSALFRSAAQANNVHIFYFARIEDGIRPTVFIDDLQSGDTIPVERLPQTL